MLQKPSIRALILVYTGKGPYPPAVWGNAVLAYKYSIFSLCFNSSFAIHSMVSLTLSSPNPDKPEKLKVS